MDVAPLPPLPKVRRREVLAWSMYDWANSAYSTISITVLAMYVLSTLNAIRPNLGVVVWGYGIGGTAMVAAILSPILGAVADAHASKRRWLALTALGGSLASCLMYLATPDRPWLLVLLFLTAHLCFELSFSFYNAFLPEIATDENMGRISGWGFGMGYIGGGLALLAVLLIFQFGPSWGLPTQEHDSTKLVTRLSLLLMGLWWGLFTLPTLYWLKDRNIPLDKPQTLVRATRKATREVWNTLRHIRLYRTLAMFLLGFLIYNDGVQTVITQSIVFAENVLQMTLPELVPVILMIQFIAMPGALLVGWLADRRGQKFALGLCLAIWVGLLIGAFFITTQLHFWMMAVVVALVLGGTQSVSRAIMGLMIPRERTAEFFGFFSFSSKAVSFLGPVLFSTIVFWTDNARWALSSLLLFFLLGWFIVSRVDLDRGRREAKEA